MGFFKKTTVVTHFKDCEKCNGQGSVVVIVDPEDKPSFKIRQTCDKCTGTGKK